MSLNMLLKGVWLALATASTYMLSQSLMPSMTLHMTMAAFATTALIIYALTRAEEETTEKETLYCAWPRVYSQSTLVISNDF